MAYRVEELAAWVEARIVGDRDRAIIRVAALDAATPDCLSFVSSDRYRGQLATTRAGAVLVAPDLEASDPATPSESRADHPTWLVVGDPYAAFARLAQVLHPPPSANPGVAPSAVIDPSAFIAPDAEIGPQCVVGAGAVVESGVILGPGCILGAGAIVGHDSRLLGRCYIETGCRLGAHCVIQPGVTIGGDGFGYASSETGWIKIPQLGGVSIGDEVEIGANTTIDRGTLGDTVIEKGVKLDNLIQVAHNVHIGAHTAAASMVGISGSTRIGSRCTLGGSVGIAGHLTIADDVHITGMTMVTRSIREPGVYSSGVAVEKRETWRKNAVRFRQLDDIARRVTDLEKRAKIRDAVSRG